MKPKCTLGIDPGLTGALALFNPSSPLQKVHPLGLIVFDMPVHKIRINGKMKSRIDVYELARWLDAVQKHNDIVHAFIEDVQASPQMGVTSAFAFGKTAGIVEAIVAAHFIPMTLARPQLWKKVMGLTADKDACRRRASQLLPGFADKWSRVKDDGRAESALIAYYGAQQLAANPVS